MRLTGKIALVTGAGQGIGRAIAQAFAAEGAKVVVSDVSADSAQQTLASLAGKEDCISAICDVSDGSAVERLFTEIGQRYGRLDILVNNAGIGQTAGDGFDKYQARLAQRMEQLQRGETPTVFGDQIVDMTDQGFEKVLGVNLGGAFHCSREAVKLMIKNGTEGSIVNISSTSAFSGEGGLHYSAAKAGILGLTHGLAADLGPRRIRVNAICPGPTLTPALMSISEEWRQSMAAGVPLGRLAEPQEVAATALFLASDDASYITGHTLMANGGSYMR
jgi:3-oxoacyl-[acyl-carrier protein] reductase